MLEHIDGILSATDGLSSREILDSYIVIRAVERSLQIISEAAKELPAGLLALEPEIPWRSIVGIGNLLRHEYYRIRDDDIIDILHHHLPDLRPAVLRLIEGLEKPRS
ncbi:MULTISPECIES: DUF86 domain-containing protein [unclassified Aureimonas]|uniref:HepT-like ribonuclease domain-containing protein n=1 Tax=unclassified Aureimonas TaxID=2615206 RepID=UPI001FCE0DC7|nr:MULTISPECIES: HepT-like ribonuclease domain-containing protein [unclassified Aureimonas]